MNRKGLSIMTRFDHQAAAREWATVHNSVASFERFSRTGRDVPSRLHTNVKRIHKVLSEIHSEMQKVETLTRPGDAGMDPVWRERGITRKSSRTATKVLTLADHIAAARALGSSQPAVRRLLDIIGGRRHLPVRILDFGIRIDHLIQIVRSEMEDVQFVTLRGQDRRVNCWLGVLNYFEGKEAGRIAQGKNALEVQL